MIKAILKRVLPAKVIFLIRRYLELKKLYKTKRVQKYLIKYLPKNIPDITEQSVSDYSKLPIWQLWLQGEDNAPDIIKNCLRSVKKYNPERQVILLTNENIHNYISLPSFIIDKYNKGIISNTHYSDIIRVILLHKYGGTWIDATVMLTDKIPVQILESEFFCFSSPKDSLYYKQHLISSWFIHSRPNHVFMDIIKNSLFSYWKNENELLDYFLLHILFCLMINKNKGLKNIWDKLYHLSNKEPHLLQNELNNIYYEDIFEKIKSITSIHKLTYKIENKISGSFFEYLSKNS